MSLHVVAGGSLEVPAEHGQDGGRLRDSGASGPARRRTAAWPRVDGSDAERHGDLGPDELPIPFVADVVGDAEVDESALGHLEGRRFEVFAEEVLADPGSI